MSIVDLRRTALGFFVVILAAVTGGAVRGQPTAIATDIETGTLMRALLSAEVEMKGRGNLSELLQTSVAGRFRDEVNLLDPQAGTWKDYRIQVVTSGSGDHFQIAVLPTTACRQAWFGAQDSRIFAGKQLGCK